MTMGLVWTPTFLCVKIWEVKRGEIIGMQQQPRVIAAVQSQMRERERDDEGERGDKQKVAFLQSRTGRPPRERRARLI